MDDTTTLENKVGKLRFKNQTTWSPTYDNRWHCWEDFFLFLYC